MRFLLPQFLYILPFVWMLLGVALWMRARWRRDLLTKFAGAATLPWMQIGQSKRRRNWDMALLFIIVTAALATLARPLYFRFDDRSETQGASYLMALDVSRSMLAPDLKPTRYGAVTNALDRFLQDTRADRIGLITFAGVGYLNAPLTFDTRALRAILSYINPTAVIDPGSSMASAMDRAVRYFTSNSLPQRTLVLISDGEELDSGRALHLARILHREHKLTIHTIGVGTATGSRIPAFRPAPPVGPAIGMPGRVIAPGPIPAQANGSDPQITTKLDENNLRRVANAGGGHYYRLGQNGEGFTQLREEVLRPLAEKTARADLQNYREGYFVPLAMTIAAIIGRMLLGADRFRSPARRS